MPIWGTIHGLVLGKLIWTNVSYSGLDQIYNFFLVCFSSVSKHIYSESNVQIFFCFSSVLPVGEGL